MLVLNPLGWLFGLPDCSTPSDSIHGEGSACPHPRVLPNLVAACLGAVFLLEGVRRRAPSSDSTPLASDEAQAIQRLQFFVGVVATV